MARRPKPGRLGPRRPPVDLRDLGPVLVEQSAFERWLGIGQVRVVGREPALLAGVRDPHRIAQLILRCAERARRGLDAEAEEE